MPRHGGTFALRIQFKGHGGDKVLYTSQNNVQSLVPWLRATLSSLHLPHPKPTNVLKSIDTSSIIDMFWDQAEGYDVRNYVLHPPFFSDSRGTPPRPLRGM